MLLIIAAFMATAGISITAAISISGNAFSAQENFTAKGISERIKEIDSSFQAFGNGTKMNYEYYFTGEIIAEISGKKITLIANGNSENPSEKKEYVVETQSNQGNYSKTLKGKITINAKKENEQIILEIS
jgi:hypothetical protein